MSHAVAGSHRPEAAHDRAPAAASPRDAEARAADPPTDDSAATATLVEADLLVEDVSIDGMCGVY
jgi:mycofactocin precursor